MPSALLPSALLPSALLPSALLPSALLPSALLPSALLPSALLIDLCFGDPRWLPHPVRALGTWSGWIERWLYHDRILSGVVSWLAVVVPAVAVAGGCTWIAECVHPWAGWGVAVLAVWLATAARDLADHAHRVQRQLAAKQLPASRRAVGRLVGRDTANLNQTDVARAAIEAVAESTVDAVVAPMMWATVGLLLAGPAGAAAGAWLLRAANTLDSVWGHRDARYHRYGRMSARVDDALAFLPARITATLLVLLGSHPRRTLHGWWKEAHLHASPNAGRPEATMAAALDVRLGGNNCYDGELVIGPVFHADGRLPTAADIGRSVNLMMRVTLATPLLLSLVVERLQ